MRRVFSDSGQGNTADDRFGDWERSRHSFVRNATLREDCVPNQIAVLYGINNAHS